MILISGNQKMSRHISSLDKDFFSERSIRLLNVYLKPYIVYTSEYFQMM